MSLGPRRGHASPSFSPLGNRADRILLLLVLLAIAAGFRLAAQQAAALPQSVRIYHGNRLIARYPYPQPGTPARIVEVTGDLGSARISIAPEGVRMIHAPCGSQQCVASGVHRQSGDMIVCLPNRISVLIIGRADRQPPFDALGQ
ncbi:MAG: hypothetical protein D6682_04130 [Zetaproteobacteria bacterium]|nr:MAG: hypothetical protein D6682_04130 [Zetaproteobacteria bacterium]